MVNTIVKETLVKLKLHTETQTLIMWELNTPFSSRDRSFSQKLNGEIMKLIDNKNEIDLTDIYRTFHPNTQKIICSSQQFMEPSMKFIIKFATK